MNDHAHLLQEALAAKENALTPASGIKVGAALLTSDGKIYRGCNIETKFPDGICAERVALINALSDGARHFTALAVVMRSGESVYPCGRCRQFIHEVLDGKDLTIVMPTVGDTPRTIQLSALLPHAYLNQTLHPAKG